MMSPRLPTLGLLGLLALAGCDGGGGGAQDAPDADNHDAQVVSQNSVVTADLGLGAAGTEDLADFYRVQAVAPGSVLCVETAGAGTSPVLDTILNVYDSAGTLLDSNDDISLTNTYSRIAYTTPPTTDGTFYAEVRPYRSTEPLIVSSGGYTVTIGDCDVADVFSVTGLAAGDRLVAGTWPATSALHDTMLEILDQDESSVATDDDGGPGLLSAIDYRLPAGAGTTHYISVRPYSLAGGGGSYVLRVERIRP